MPNILTKSQQEPRAVLIAGPTASGKSGFAVALAEQVGGEVINADASQVYSALPILTAQPTAQEIARVPHRLYGFLPPSERFSVKAWLDTAKQAIEAAQSLGRLPIIVGGTGLYFRALLEGLSEIPEIPAAVRERAAQQFDALGPERFDIVLREADPEAATRLALNDRYRRIRALEVVEGTGRPLSAWHEHQGAGILRFSETAAFVISPPREDLYARCDARFEDMLSEGVLDEVRAIIAQNLDAKLPIMKVLGLRELAAHIGGTLSLDEAVETAQLRTRQYAKRQLTWARGQMADWQWLAPSDLANWHF